MDQKALDEKFQGLHPSIINGAYYSHRKVCDMEWNLREAHIDNSKFFEQLEFQAAPCSGPVARMKTMKELVETYTTRRIYIDRQDGAPISSINVITKNDAYVSSFGWNHFDQLALVYSDGTLLYYDVRGRQTHSTRLIDARGVDVVFSKVFWDAAIVVDSSFGIHVIDHRDYDGTSSIPIAHRVSTSRTDEIKEAVSTVLDVGFCPDTSHFVFLSPEALFIMQPGDEEFRIFYYGSREHFAKVSCVESYLALASNKGKLVITDVTYLLSRIPYSDLGIDLMLRPGQERNRSIFLADYSEVAGDLGCPDQVEWISNENVALYWKSKRMLLILDPLGSSERILTYNVLDGTREPVFLSHEEDGLKVFSPLAQHFVSRIPDSVIDIFVYKENGYQLLEALDAYHQSSAFATIGDLRKSIDQCIDAAEYVAEPELKERLLEAAYYGKSFLDEYDNDSFAAALRLQRLVVSLNRHSIPITTSQLRRYLQRHSPKAYEALVWRISNVFGKHALAFAIAKSADIDRSGILESWAVLLIERNRNLDNAEEALADRIMSQILMVNSDSVFYGAVSTIAEAALSFGFLDLAGRLVALERDHSVSVPLLMRMERYSEALRAAEESGDGEFMFYAISFLLRRHDLEEVLYSHVTPGTPLHFHFLLYGTHNRRASLARYFQRKGLDLERAMLMLYSSFLHLDAPGRRVQLLYKAKSILEESPKVMDEYNSVLVAHLEKESRLQFEQETLEDRVRQNHKGVNFVGLSAAETLRKILEVDAEYTYEDALAFRKSVSMNKKRFEWIVATALIRRGDDQSSQIVTKIAKKSTFGLERFVECAIKSSRTKLALDLVKMMPTSNSKVEFLLRLEEWDEAMRTSVDLGDRDTVEKVLTVAPRRTISRLILIQNNMQRKRKKTKWWHL